MNVTEEMLVIVLLDKVSQGAYKISCYTCKHDVLDSLVSQFK